MTRQRWLSAVSTGVLCGLLVALVPAAPAKAHARLMSTAPAAGTILGSNPSEVLLTFSEAVTPVPGMIKVIGPNGDRADRDLPPVRGSVLAIAMTAPAPRGTYLVSYRVISADGHPLAGTFSYSVGETSTMPALQDDTGGRTDPALRVLMSVGKYLGYAGLVLIIGPVLVMTALWPRRLSRHTPARLVWLGVGLVGVGAVSGIVLQAPYTTGERFTRITAAGVRDVLGTSLGAMYVLRLVVLVVASLLLRQVLAGQRGATRSVLLAGLGVVGVATFPLAGHPALSPVPLVTVLADAVHLVGMAVWLGGLVMLIGFLLRRANNEELVAILPIWSRWAAVAVSSLLLAGTVTAVLEVQTPQALISTTYGRLVLTKVGLVAAVLAVAYWSRRMVFAGTAARLPDRLRRLVGAELAVAAVVIAVAAALVQTAPARTASAEAGTEATPANPHTATLTNELFDLRVEITPARAGSNTVHLYAYTVEDGPKAVAEWTATAAPADGALEPIVVTLLPVTENQALGDVVLPSAGTWVFRFTLRVSEVDQSTVTTIVTVS